VCEIQFDGFVFPAYDQIINQVAKMHFRSMGKLNLPIVIRIPFGGGIGAVEHHSESPESLFAHVAGLKVVACGDPVDAYWMIQQAIATDDPVVFFEPKRRYHEKGELDESVTTAPVPLHQATVRREGTDATLFCYGPMVKTCLQAAEAAMEDGNDLEVVDLRTISPLDLATIFESVKKTRRVVVVHEAPLTLGPAAELAARVTEECFYHLEAPVLRVAGFDTPYPPSRVEEDYLPDLDRVLDGVDKVMEY
jgi:pyruvate dehydrogenase E1 component beta subunit